MNKPANQSITLHICQRWPWLWAFGDSSSPYAMRDGWWKYYYNGHSHSSQWSVWPGSHIERIYGSNSNSMSRPAPVIEGHSNKLTRMDSPIHVRCSMMGGPRQPFCSSQCISMGNTESSSSCHPGPSKALSQSHVSDWQNLPQPAAVCHKPMIDNENIWPTNWNPHLNLMVVTPVGLLHISPYFLTERQSSVGWLNDTAQSYLSDPNAIPMLHYLNNYGNLIQIPIWK